jgi:hypothetical protein
MHDGLRALLEIVLAMLQVRQWFAATWKRNKKKKNSMYALNVACTKYQTSPMCTRHYQEQSFPPTWQVIVLT